MFSGFEGQFPLLAEAAGKPSTTRVPLSAVPRRWAALGALTLHPKEFQHHSGVTGSKPCRIFFFLFFVGFFFLFFFLATPHLLLIKQELNKKAVIVLRAINLRAITYAFEMRWQGIICNEKLLPISIVKACWLLLYLEVDATHSVKCSTQISNALYGFAAD